MPPKVFISYSHDTRDHMDRILALSNQLRGDGVDCQIDQYQESPPIGWPRWCEKQTRESEFVLVACTETYLRRFSGDETPGEGKGVTWEGYIITQDLYDSQGTNDKFIPITFAHADATTVPSTLRGAARYDLPDAYEALYRSLTHQPLITAPPLGEVKPMPPRQILPAQPELPRKQAFLPPWNVPHARNPFFTGREEILTELNTTLGKTGTAALSGLGGVGKTQTAVEFAHLHRDDYQAVLWASAESRETLLSGFAAIANHLNLSEANATDQQTAATATKRWLESNTGWLLILDNADELAIAREFFPQPSKGHILLTTRAHATEPIAERVEIKKMDLAEAVLFLLHRADVTPTDAERMLAKQISTELGCLPLALDQAGAFIYETPSSLAEYLNLHRKDGPKLLAARGDLAADHAPVNKTFRLAFEKVATNSPAAADLIRICAFLAPDAIPEEIFTTAAKELGDHLSKVASNPFEFTQMLKEATRFSLIDRTPSKKALDIHRLVQAVVKDAMKMPQQRTWAKRAVRAVNLAFPDVEFSNWSTCDRLLPHAQACADRIAQFHFEFNEATRLLNQAGYYLSMRARYIDAESLFRRSLAIREKTLGLDHPDVASSLNNLAVLYKAQGKYADAEPLYCRSLAIRENVLEPNHPDIAISLNNLALLYEAHGKYAEAEPLYKRSLAIREQSLEADHGAVATSLNNLAALYHNQGKYAEAEPLYRRSLEITEKALGPEHPDVAVSLNNLAELYRVQAKYAEAEPLYQQSLVIRKKALGPDHPDVARSLNNVAVLYQDQGKYAEAEPLYRRSLAIKEEALGPDHPEVAISLNNLAGLYKAQGKYDEAEPLCHGSLVIFEKALGPDHPIVATTLENLADLLTRTNRAAEARTLTSRAEKIRAKHAQQNS